MANNNGVANTGQSTTTKTLSVSERKGLVMFGMGHFLILFGGVMLAFCIGMSIALLVPKAPGEFELDTTGKYILWFFIVLFFWGGVLILRKGLVGRALRRRLKTYIELIVNKNMRSIENIASELRRSDVEKVMDEIQEVIDLGFLRKFKIDRGTRSLDDTLVKMKLTDASNQGLTKATFTCDACGANNIAFYSVGSTIFECEYCGKGRKV